MSEPAASLTRDPGAFDATRTDRAIRCYSCEKIIPDGGWFARIRLGEGRVAFCSPHCLEKFLDSPDRYAHLQEQQLFR